MKIKPHHYAALKKCMEANMDEASKHREFIVNEGKAKDVDKRLRWDLLWAIPRDVRTPLLDEIYQYANDTNIDTALRSIMARA